MGVLYLLVLMISSLRSRSFRALYQFFLLSSMLLEFFIFGIVRQMYRLHGFHADFGMGMWMTLASFILTLVMEAVPGGSGSEGGHNAV